MDPIVIVIIVVVVMPLAVVGGLAYSARLRGPLTRSESRRPVGSLVTDVIPQDRSEDDAVDEPGPEFTIDSPAPEPDPGLRSSERDRPS